MSARSAASRRQPVRDEQLERLVERQRVRAVRREERAGLDQPTGRRSGAPSGSAARPRTCSRLPRTVLISPLWASARNGWASPHVGMRVGRVALVEDAWLTGKPRGEVRVQGSQAPAGDEALVDDRSARGRRDGERRASGRRSRAASSIRRRASSRRRSRPARGRPGGPVTTAWAMVGRRRARLPAERLRIDRDRPPALGAQ